MPPYGVKRLLRLDVILLVFPIIQLRTNVLRMTFRLHTSDKDREKLRCSSNITNMKLYVWKAAEHLVELQ